MPLKYFKQEKDWTCGAASMRMILYALGIKKTEDEVASLLGTKQCCGTLNKDFPRVAEYYKLNYVVFRNSSISALKKFFKDGYLIIVGHHDPIDDVGHYAVVKNITRNKIFLLDPSHGPNHSHSLKDFESYWSVLSKGDNEKRWFFAIKPN